MPETTLVFLKLGGSLITNKSQPHSPRPDIIRRLAEEIATALQSEISLRLLLGHGSGSFGHVPARKYGTRQGVHTPQEWRGFAEVWSEAAALNHLVLEALQQAGLPAVAFPPSASVIAYDGKVMAWDTAPLQAALTNGLLPVVYGDVVFDTSLGGTILSTEDLFEHLAKILQPERLLLCGREPGVWVDYPACTRLASEITPLTLLDISKQLGGSAAVDVTGGMESKVRQALSLVEANPGLEALIFSGEEAGILSSVLRGERHGTLVINPV